MDDVLSITKYERVGLKFNPFSKRPLEPHDMRLMVGRKKEARMCFKAIARCENCIIYGLKGIGKTTLINYVRYRCERAGVYTSFLNMPTSTRKFLISLLIGLIKNKPKKMDATVYHKIIRDVNKYQNSPTVLSSFMLEQYIDKYIDMLDSQYPVVVFIDEIHNIVKKSDAYLSSFLCTYLFKKEFVFIGSGLTTFYKSTDPSTDAMRDRFSQEVTLKPLNEKETRALILKRLKDAWVEENAFLFPEEILDLVWEYSYGNPRLIITLCGDLVDVALEDELNENSCMEILKKHNLLYSQRLQEGLHGKTKEVYSLILQHNPITPTQLSELLVCSPQSVQYHLNILYSYGLITKIGMRPRTKYVPRTKVF